uniref:Homeobox domain-containing protein n=1 Tax=Caenorhabditis tropicalis TaxID=1561998 RepID=A0A1I7UVQ1_9PELO
MDEKQTLAKSHLFMSTMAGRVPSKAVEEICLKMPVDDLYRLKCKMAIKLRENKPYDALKLAEGWKIGDEYPEGVRELVECAKSHIQVDNMLLESGFQPPPPAPYFFDESPYVGLLQFRVHQEIPIRREQVPAPVQPPMNPVSHRSRTRQVFGMERRISGNVIHLPAALRTKLIEEHESRNMKMSYEDLIMLSKKYQVAISRLFLYFNNRRRYYKRQDKLKSSSGNTTISGSSEEPIVMSSPEKTSSSESPERLS